LVFQVHSQRLDLTHPDGRAQVSTLLSTLSGGLLLTHYAPKPGLGENHGAGHDEFKGFPGRLQLSSQGAGL
jgi:hypothetical protein